MIPAAIKRAEAKGYLLVGPDTDDALLTAWWQHCRAKGRLFSLEVEGSENGGYHVTLRTLAERLSLKAIDELSLVSSLFERAWNMTTGGPECMVWSIERRHLRTAVDLLWRVMGRERQRVELNAAYFPVEGLAVCIDNEGMEHLLKLGESVYIRELPNMRGHCLILVDGRPPIIGWHLDRFRMNTGDGQRFRRRHYGVKPSPWPTRHHFWMNQEGRWSGFEGRAPN